MSDETPRPRGLFNRATTGHKTPVLKFEVEAGRIAFFASTLGDDNPVYYSREAARAAGYPAIPAPPTFAMVIDVESGRAAEREGQPSAFDVIGCDYTRLLHGEESYEYHGMIYAGDEVEITTEVLGFEDKKGGALEVANLRAQITHPERGLLVEISRKLIHRLG